MPPLHLQTYQIHSDHLSIQRRVGECGRELSYRHWTIIHHIDILLSVMFYWAHSTWQRVSEIYHFTSQFLSYSISLVISCSADSSRLSKIHMINWTRKDFTRLSYLNVCKCRQLNWLSHIFHEQFYCVWDLVPHSLCNAD